MEQIPEPDTTNLVYMDEYPHLTEKLRLQRLHKPIREFVLPTVVEIRPNDNDPNPPAA